MTLIETVQLPGPPAQAWELLARGGGALRLTPGIAVGPDGRGTLRIVLGSHSLTYRGYARQHVEEEGRHLTWTLSGKEVRGTGRAHAEVRARFREAPQGGTDLRLTVLVGGRGRLAETTPGEQDRALSSVIARFRRAVAKELEEVTPAGGAPAPARAQPTPASGPPEQGPTAPQRRAEARVEVMPPSSPARRALPAGAAAASALALGIAGLLLWRWRRRG